jgi:UDP-N-acetylglucosamine diphosphorylase / glucose-1-phosphate thymidylyltransferase / UDP-N-acetylgalactosamine diphosphorylase / glucosamine-1-phosphate N-acetyltransferase / galactosamine-1-phosphate N-acetyltransferase
MHLCLFEDATVHHLAPLALTRHAADLRLAMHTLAEMQVAAFRPAGVTFHARPHVAGVTRQEHPGSLVNELPAGAGVLMVNARYVPEPGDVLERIRAASGDARGVVFRQGDSVVAAWMPEPPAGLMDREVITDDAFDGLPDERVEGARMIGRLWELLDDVGEQVARDFAEAGKRGRDAATVHDGAVIVGDDVYLAPGAQILPGAVINALGGPVWIGEGATVEEQAVVRGPCYVGPKAQIKAAARIDESAVGYFSKVGGEVHASVFHSLAGKAHDGYAGNSYLGRWCNLGADTNTSNLKNDYGQVTMFDAVEQDFVASGRQFLGLVMGDHSKCSINTMFNTGTVVGVFCNLYGADFPPRHIPSFSWGGASGVTEYRLEKALRVAEAVMARRDTPLTDADREMLSAVFDMRETS